MTEETINHDPLVLDESYMRSMAYEFIFSTFNHGIYQLWAQEWAHHLAASDGIRKRLRACVLGCSRIWREKILPSTIESYILSSFEWLCSSRCFYGCLD